MISQNTPLHAYPMLCITLFSILARGGDDTVLHQRSRRLSALTLEHSRLVLLLQSLVHSASVTPASESDEEEDMLGPTPPTGLRSPPQQHGVRELVFPAPLSAMGADPASSSDDITSFSVSSKSGARRVLTRTGTIRSQNSTVSYSLRASSVGPRPTPTVAETIPRGHKSSGFSSLFHKTRVPPPPPSEDPRALKMYASSWRRTLSPGTRNSVAFAAAESDDDDWLLQQPHRRFASVSFSSESSLSSPSSISRTNTDSEGGSGRGASAGARRASAYGAPVADGRGAGEIGRAHV